MKNEATSEIEQQLPDGMNTEKNYLKRATADGCCESVIFVSDDNLAAIALYKNEVISTFHKRSTENL